MNRFQKLAALTLATALGLVTIGVIVRATDSGLGCPDWPLCHGQLIPALGDTKAWIEWLHRTVAVVIGFEILALAILAVRDYRDRRSILWPSLAAVGLVGFQAWLGRETVRLGNSGESVTAHLASAMILVAVLVYITVRAGYPARIGGRGASQRCLPRTQTSPIWPGAARSSLSSTTLTSEQSPAFPALASRWLSGPSRW